MITATRYGTFLCGMTRRRNAVIVQDLLRIRWTVRIHFMPSGFLLNFLSLEIGHSIRNNLVINSSVIVRNKKVVRGGRDPCTAAG